MEIKNIIWALESDEKYTIPFGYLKTIHSYRISTSAVGLRFISTYTIHGLLQISETLWIKITHPHQYRAYLSLFGASDY
uniref:Uncharacterized protein n=1 Tax=Tetranychus urticae TaxID=32264 RepID=T1KDK0_TETUR